MRLLLLAVALLGAVAPAAAAQSRLVRTEARMPFASDILVAAAGPRLLGDEVLWAERRPGPNRIGIGADGPAGRRDAGSVTPIRASVFHFDAAEGRAALTAYDYGCEDDDEACGRYQMQGPLSVTLFTGSTAGPLLADAGFPCAAPVVPEVAGDAVAAFCFGGFTIREDDGRTRRIQSRGGADLQLAGGYAAYSRPSAGESPAGVVVENRRSGEEVVRVPGPARGFHLTADGTIAVALPDRQVALASPAQPAPRTLTAPFDAGSVRVAGDRVVVRSPGTVRDAGPARFAVLDRAGAVVAEHAVSDAQRDWDFDGRRVAWLQRPCSLVTVAVWEVAGAPPPPAGDRCGHAVVRRGRVAVTRRLRVALPVSCPAQETAGCAGRLDVVLAGRARTGRRTARRQDSASYDLDPGASGFATSGLVARDVRRSRSLRSLRLEARSLTADSLAKGPVVRIPVRLPRR